MFQMIFSLLQSITRKQFSFFPLQKYFFLRYISTFFWLSAHICVFLGWMEPSRRFLILVIMECSPRRGIAWAWSRNVTSYGPAEIGYLRHPVIWGLVTWSFPSHQNCSRGICLTFHRWWLPGFSAYQAVGSFFWDLHDVLWYFRSFLYFSDTCFRYFFFVLMERSLITT